MGEPLRWRHRTGEIILDRTRVMGVLNVTPDSFFDGGRYLDPQAAIRRGLEMADQGADILDVGGESTRPGSEGIDAAEEWRRVGDVIETLAAKVDVPLSVDTRKPEVAEKAVAAGAGIVNDVSGLRDPKMVQVVAKARAGVVIMHMLGEPKTMQAAPRYVDVVAEVRDYLAGQAKGAMAAGVAPEAIAVDPGIGFGKAWEHNVSLLRRVDALSALGHPVVIGVSRKSFLAKGGGREAEERLPGSLAAAAFAVVRGAHVVRAHDVPETIRAMRVVDALLERPGIGSA